MATSSIPGVHLREQNYLEEIVDSQFTVQSTAASLDLNFAIILYESKSTVRQFPILLQYSV